MTNGKSKEVYLVLPSTCRGLLIHIHTHAHTSHGGFLFTCSSECYITIPGFHFVHAWHSDWLPCHLVCVSLGVCVTMLHNAAAGLNTPGSQNYDCMCQSQYLWKPKTLEPVHPSPLPSTCSFFLSPCGCLGYKPAPKPSGMTGSVCVDTWWGKKKVGWVYMSIKRWLGSKKQTNTYCAIIYLSIILCCSFSQSLCLFVKFQFLWLWLQCLQ